ncbi:LVIVD repeat-containing protein [Dyadobacter sp. NIV53]|uniref:LVIVD repeat-containing protein n=1 Tax=Dyadobacter sp. NIV53 TaxID=2861765 RepID=UPI001C88DAC7|nr:hypothetical protein [Dyadobacter sp. NIV53]
MKKITPFLFIGIAFIGLIILITSCDSSSDSAVSPQTGLGGSMARFAITGNTLYIVSRQSLEVYNIANGGNPVKAVTKNINVGIETIFPYKNHLFIGATDGMYIYNNLTPDNPTLLTKYTHVQSCDPVVVQGNYAYVTLRGGVVCRNWVAQSSLDVVDISNPGNPQLINSQSMQSPYGLGVSGKRLFVCEGDNGFKVLDISDPQLPVIKHHFTDLASYDVIVKNNRLIITGAKGLFQYLYDEDDNVELLSKIPVL